ncbi:MAG: hypothetical protein LBK42_05995 [Propionibacteriaceae bacterium]|jgi:hypothetical protein|nr:hypothetical protein [Propionibacteriaceae bacterium]
MDDSWMEFRRGSDGERLGWIAPSGDGFVPLSLLGRPLSQPVSWDEAERRLEDAGIGYLAGVWLLDTADGPQRVRFQEVTPTQARLITDNYSAIDAPFAEIVLPIPAPDGLRRL